MTVSGIVTAVAVGLVVGALGRWLVPSRHNAPIWLAMAVGVAAALLGTILARAAGLDTSHFDVLTLLIQIGLSLIAAVVVAATAGRRRTSDVP